MELRSSAYRRLVAKPQDAGVYEEGMPYGGLKQLAQAVEMSAQEANEDEEKLHFERARYESELEFLSSQPMDQSTNQPCCRRRLVPRLRIWMWISHSLIAIVLLVGPFN
ncbi:uncharacterized protein DMAD_01909 [Drosophila madeirensis]|uniref:Uncharacterized protein n=1 Tax=Drosophila madeirensis TaxID=30013 RepID=A0AAU9G1R7_DROMD